MQDRLAELDNGDLTAQDNIQLDFVEEGANEEDTKVLDQTQQQFDQINEMIDVVLGNTEQITKLEVRCNRESSEEAQHQILQELDQTILETRKLAKQIKDYLTVCKQKNEEYDIEHKYSTIAQWRHNKLNTTSIRFQKSIMGFNSASADFKQSLRDKIARQVRLVNRDITEDQIEEIVNSPNPSKYMQAALMIPDALLDRVAEIEERHEGIVQIERGVAELQSMFSDLALLIDAQQEQLDHIENNVIQTRQYVEKGRAELEKAQKHQIGARKKTMILICCFAVILVIILIFVFA